MARYLSAAGQRWLKTIHIVLCCAWIGGAASLVLVQGVYGRSTGVEASGLSVAMRAVDDWIIIPGAMGCLLTGLMYSVWTRWGFFRHGWVAAKWALTIAQITFGTFWLGPWLNANGDMIQAMGASATMTSEFVSNARSNFVGGLIQAILLMLMVGLSVFKPRRADRAKGVA